MIHIKAFTFSPISENTYVLYNDEGKSEGFDVDHARFMKILQGN
jgi:hypothetical protein